MVNKTACMYQGKNDQHRMVMRQGYCYDCSNNPPWPIANVVKRWPHHPCNGCWCTDAKASWKSLGGRQYVTDDGTLMNANGTRSIFDDVDE